jgi:hypothetical protein
MVKYADHASLLTSLPTVEEVLDNHASQLKVRPPASVHRGSAPPGQARASIDGSFS